MTHTEIGDAPKLYRRYSARQLEVQYDNRAAVPEFAEITKTWAKSSALMRQSASCQLDLSYGGREREKIDLFSCDTPLSPLLVFVHGGYWQRMDKRNYSFVAKKFLEHGINVALVGYDLCPTVGLHDIVQQIRSACIWLWSNADQLKFDQDKIFISGHSAGGHLAAMALTTDWQKIDATLPLVVVQGGLATSGIFDLEPLRYTSINHALSLNHEYAIQNSPVYRSPSSSVRILLAVGALESEELRRQTHALASAWKDKASELTTIAVPGANHFTILDYLSDSSHPLFQSALGILRGYKHLNPDISPA